MGNENRDDFLCPFIGRESYTEDTEISSFLQEVENASDSSPSFAQILAFLESFEDSSCPLEGSWVLYGAALRGAAWHGAARWFEPMPLMCSPLT